MKVRALVCRFRSIGERGWRASALGLLVVVALSGCELPSALDPFRVDPPDLDADGVPDYRDNCRELANRDQLDLDDDELGDACDPDRDGDGMLDTWELQKGLDAGNPDDADQDQDADGLTSFEEYHLGTHPLVADTDRDAVLDGVDNCPFHPDVSQADLDEDGKGDICDPDIDGDGFSNEDESFLGTNPHDADETWRAPELRRISTSLEGGAANGYSHSPALSDDGTKVVFTSSATNLISGDQNDRLDVFLADTGTGTISRISQTAGGTGGNSDSLKPLISGNGEVVIFHSPADNLVPNDENAQQDVFVFDSDSNLLELGSVSSSGVQTAAWPSYVADLHDDGRVIYFNTNARNIGSGVTRYQFNLFRHDRESGKTSHSHSSVNASVSANGEWIVFETAERLVLPDDNRARDIVLYESATGSVRRLSRTPVSPDSDGDSFNPDISSDGRFVSFESDATNLVPADNNGVRDIFVQDIETGIPERVSLAWNGEEANGNSYASSISHDGRFVAFSSDATNLVQYDFNGARDVFLYDRTLDFIRRVSVSTGGAQGNRASDEPHISGDGRCVVFVSSSGNLDDLGDNHQRDVYLYCR